MKCPGCGKLNIRKQGQTTLGSRLIKNGLARKRYKICLHCEMKFTTIETIREIKNENIRRH